MLRRQETEISIPVQLLFHGADLRCRVSVRSGSDQPDHLVTAVPVVTLNSPETHRSQTRPALLSSLPAHRRPSVQFGSQNQGHRRRGCADEPWSISRTECYLLFLEAALGGAATNAWSCPRTPRSLRSTISSQSAGAPLSGTPRRHLSCWRLTAEAPPPPG